MGKPSWNLEREGSPDRTAKELVRNSAYRHEACGTWNPRHQRTFVNNVHTNLKEYFDRARPIEEEEKPGLHKRKLDVDWSLQDRSSVEFSSTLRSDNSPSSPSDDKAKAVKGGGEKPKSKHQPTWFSRHGVTFLDKEGRAEQSKEDRRRAALQSNVESGKCPYHRRNRLVSGGSIQETTKAL